MHRDDYIGRQRLDLGDGVVDIIRWCNAQMEAAEYGVQLVHAGDRHRGPDGVEHAAMAAGGDDDEASPLHDIARGMLVRMPVGDKSPASLLLGEMIHRSRLDQGVGNTRSNDWRAMLP